MKYRAIDGYEAEAQSYQELAEKLWHSMFIPDDNIQDWMLNSAKRAAIYNGSVIRTDTVEHHIQDLIEAGFISKVHDSK